MSLHHRFFILLTIPLLLLIAGCSLQRNTATTRQWQAFNTRFNVYFNGAEHYEEQCRSMEDNYNDDFTRLLPVHPAEARADEQLPQPTGDFTRTIEKMQKAIQLRSITRRPPRGDGSKEDREFRRREEFNPFIHNAWLLLGKSMYMNGDFSGAAAIFGYAAHHFRWLPDVVTECKIRQALAYSAIKMTYEADELLRRIMPDELSSIDMRHLYYLAKTSVEINMKNYASATEAAKHALALAYGSQKHRLAFLLGQLAERASLTQLADSAFRIAGSGISTSPDLKFEARIKRSEAAGIANPSQEIKRLRRMASYANNTSRRDRIFFAIGNLYAQQADTARAIEAYRTAIESAEDQSVNGAIAAIALGNIYYARRQYVPAQPCYSMGLTILGDSYPGYKKLKLRSDVLDELAVYAGNVNMQDSLLKIAALPQSRQMEICRLLAEDAKEKADEAKKKMPTPSEVAPIAGFNGQTEAQPVEYRLNTDNSWYFYNRTVREAGKRAFQRKWGSRKLEDNWRRSDRTSMLLPQDADSDTGENDSIASEEGKEISELNDPMSPQYYYKDIPHTEEEILLAESIIQEGLYNIGLILKDHLGDMEAAADAFHTLLTRFPDTPFALQTYHNLYLIAAKEGKDTQAEELRLLIADRFKNEPLGKAMSEPGYTAHLRNAATRQREAYEQALEAYRNGDNIKVRTLADFAEKNYPDSKLMPQFIMLDALSRVTTADSTGFRNRLELLLAKYPDADFSTMATGMLANLNKGEKLAEGSHNPLPIHWQAQRLHENMETTDTTDNTPRDIEFTRDPDVPQVVVFVFGSTTVNANTLLFRVARFNFSTFTIKTFDLERINFGDIGLLIVKGFKNKRQADSYRQMIGNADPEVIGPEVRTVIISDSDFNKLLKSGASFDDYFRSIEQDKGKQQ